MSVDEVQWVSLRRTHFPALLALAGVVAVAALGVAAYQSSPIVAIVGLVVGAALVGMYFATRSVTFSVRAGSECIAIGLVGGKAQQASMAEFLAKVEQTALAVRGGARPSA